MRISTSTLCSTALLFFLACSGPEDDSPDDLSQGAGGQVGAGGSGLDTSGGAPQVGGSPRAGGSSNVGGSLSQAGGDRAAGGVASNAGGGAISGGSNVGGNSVGSGGSNGGAENAGGTGEGGGSGGNAPLQEITVWIAGDSTVANGNTPCPRGWGGVFAPLFSDLVSVRNSAVGGRSVRTWMHFVQGTMGSDGECLLDLDGQGVPLIQDRWQVMLDEMNAGDFLLIQFGINDGSPTCDRHVGLSAFKESYGQMAQAATERGAQAIFLTPVSAISCQGATAQGTRGGFVTATQEIGIELGIPVIDLHQLSVDLYSDRGFCPLPAGHSDIGASTPGEVGSFFCDDHTHFDQPGAEAIAELVAQALLDQGSRLAEYLR